MTAKRNVISKASVVFLCVVVLSLILVSVIHSQEKGGRETSPSKPTIKRGTTRPTNRPAPKPKLASILLTINPPDSSLLIDGEPSNKVDALGNAKVTDLKPGQHLIVVRRASYRDKQQTLDLKEGENDSVRITLELLKGSLSVSPSVGGAEINLRNLGTNQPVGTYAGAISQIEFPPGNYELIVSKKGYHTATRTFTIRASESLYLEPHLEQLPSERPRPVITMVAMVATDDKYLIVQLLGTSGANLPRSGSINVSAAKVSAFADVSGSFTGLPCAIELVRLDNISEASIVEYPGSTNQWAKAVIRVRPRDSKKPVRFAINWRVRESSTANSLKQ